MTKRQKRHSLRGFLHDHGLSVVVVALFILWVCLYAVSNEKTRLGAFYGNAIADWSGSVVIVLGTKYLIERGSAESKQRPPKRGGLAGFVYEHSLTIFLVVTGVGWALLFAHSDPNSKWGQVVGNVVSEWLQMTGLVFLTKGLIERGSKESK